MQRAVDGDDVALAEHLLETIDTPAADLLLDLGLEWLVVKVQQLFAVEGLQAAEHALADTSDGNGTDDLAFQVELVLGCLGDIPVTALDLLVGRNEVADQREDGHNDVLGYGDDIGAGHFGNGDTAIGGVGGIEVDVVGADTCGDGDLKVLGLCETLGGKVARVESEMVSPVSSGPNPLMGIARRVRGELTGW